MEIPRGAVIGGGALLAVVALLGWTRGGAVHETRPAPAAVVGQPSADQAPLDQYGMPAAAPVDTRRASADSRPAPAPVRRATTHANASYAAQQPVSSRPVRRGRPASHSAAIVAGSAGVGAAIGALAGGGKGAGIGALGGGAAGLVYDRLTHNR